MSHTVDCYDNSMPNGSTGQQAWMDHARNVPRPGSGSAERVDFVEGFYNPLFRHVTLAYKNPNQFEAK